METTTKSLSTAALITGVSLIIMTIISIIIFSSLKVATLSIIGIIVIIILDILIAISLYFLLRPVNRSLSAIMSALRIIYAIIFAVALCHISDLVAFHSIWNFGLLIFGIHIFMFGLLVYISHYLPKLFGILLFIGALGYITDTILVWAGINFSIGMYTFFGEPLLAIWLVIRARKLNYVTN